MLHGSLTLLITGIALVALEEIGPDPVNHFKIAVKLVLAAIVVLLVVKNRKFASIPRGLWGLIGASRSPTPQWLCCGSKVDREVKS